MRVLIQLGILSEPLLYASPYFERRRPEYYASLQAVRERGTFSGWIGFFLRAVETQALDAVKRAESLLGLGEEYRRRLRDRKVRGGALQLADQLIANPYMTTTRAADLLGVTTQGAAYAVRQLVESEILVEAGRVGRAQLYVCSDVLDVLQAP